MSDAGPTIHQCECDVCQGGGDAATERYDQQINLFLSRLNELQRRWYVGVISQAADTPSDRQLSLITGLDKKTIQGGRHELSANLADAPTEKQRQAGGGRPRAEKRSRARSDAAGVGRAAYGWRSDE
jgi:hypothetical protein